ARSSTLSWVTLHRPPPATRIFAPNRFAPSSATIAGDAPRPRASRPAWIAGISPAAPAPTTATSTTSSSPRIGGPLGLGVDRDPRELRHRRPESGLEALGRRARPVERGGRG